jgi:UDP-N-acetylglucosamine transferase subunit ALG13
MTTLFLATTGGHLQELHALAERLPKDENEIWVTDENEQSRSLLAGRDVEFVPYVGVRAAADVARCLPTAHRLWRQRRITRAVSTGSGMALGYLPYLAARGVACHYIECSTRVTGPSLTGRILEAMPRVHRYTQQPPWAGRRWLYRGSVFDGFEQVVVPPLPETRLLRVVVTVGIVTGYPFDRLIQRLGPLLAPDGELATATGRRVEVLWQTGPTPVDHLGIEANPTVPEPRLRSAIENADIVVSHAGTGSALVALTAGRLPVLASRSARHGESVDEHQAQLGTRLQELGLAIHRDADEIVVGDLVRAMRSRIRMRTDPPAFELAS